MKQIKIPYFSIKGECNVETIRKAIEILITKYLHDWEVLDNKSKLEILETSASLTDILFHLEA